MGFLAYKRGGGGRLGGLGWCRKRGFREGAEGQKKGFKGERREREGRLMMMTDEDLREQKGRGSNREQIEVQERLSGSVVR